ncbi:MAG: hypothetical protein DMD78_05815 [Candidatus Rokuibacteriota bacterium]|nr:MAG: hypothetical protein DMD78_05815 [Candidatus Rokubacteria bacterium]
MRGHGWVGLLIIALAEAGLFAGQPLVARWFTPIVWTGYVLFVDALLFHRIGASYLTTARAELVLVVLASIGCWWLFEWYDAPRFWRGGAHRVGLWWQYHGLEPDPWLRRAGYDWSFATIFPALFLTAALLRSAVFRRIPVRPRRPSPALLKASIALGAIFVSVPLLVVNVWLVPLVWTGFVLLLEPLNYRRGRPSWLGALAVGDASLLVALLTSGLVCGVLWEFWNYWAATKWTYTVPYPGGVKVFEMPLVGYLGFPPFALECYAMYHWLRGLLGRLPGALV